jgi:hypothetical protein
MIQSSLQIAWRYLIMPLRTARVASIWLAAALLAACSSQSAPTTPPMGSAPATAVSDDSAGAPSALVTGALAPSALAPISTYPGAVIGEPNVFDPAVGDYPGGGAGQTIERVRCKPTMFINRYHVHVYLGIIEEGKQIALPRGIGMFHPGPPSNGFINTAGCFYYLHTHDSSGIVHVEAPRNNPPSDWIYTLSHVLRVWGLHLSSRGLGPIHGRLHVFVGNVPLRQTLVSTYREFMGDPNNIKLQSHEVIWLEFGKNYYTATQLPPVTFYMEY